MSGSLKFPMSSENLNFETNELDVKEEMISKDDELEEQSSDIHTIQTTSFYHLVAHAGIKQEEVDFHHNTSTSYGEDDSELKTVFSIQTGDCSSVKTPEKGVEEFYLDLLQCKEECETCQKFMKMLSEHVRATHAPPQPIQDPLHIDTDPPDPESQIKCEVDENIQKIECSDSEVLNSESDPDYNIESDAESDPDPDYDPSPSITQQSRLQRPTIVDNHTSSESRIMKSKKEIPPSRKRFDCKECGKSFKHKRSLNMHLKLHTSDKPFNCNVCKKSFALWRYLTRHQRIHSTERPFNCDQCEKSYKTLSNLNEHKRTHTAEKPYKCDACEKSYKTSSNLNEHKRTHTAERPFKCDVCEMSFTKSGHLTKHKRVHTGVKPFKCDVCTASFSRQANLTRHRNTHVQPCCHLVQL